MNKFGFLFRQPYFFRAPDDGTGEGGEGGGSKQFSQDDVNKLTGKARSDGRATALNELYTSLGVKDEAGLKALIDAGKKAEQDKLTETERLNKDLQTAKDKIAELETTASKQSAEFTRRLMDYEIKTAAGKAVVDEKTKQVTRPAFRDEALQDVLTIVDRSKIKGDGNSFTGIEDALAALAKTRPHWLADAVTKAKGTPPTPPTHAKKGNDTPVKPTPPRSALS